MQARKKFEEFVETNATVNYGKIVRYYRKEVMNWKNASTLAELYNDVLEYENVTDRWVQRMEKHNKVPVDKKRRWVLATLLNIPPAYFGLEALSSLLQDDLKLLIPTRGGNISKRAYENNLTEIWSSPYSDIDNVLALIYTLQEMFLYGTIEQRETAGPFLCEYLIAAGNMQRAQGFLPSAITYLNRAMTIAKDQKFYELEAKALYFRSYCALEQWRMSTDKGESHLILQTSQEDAFKAKILVDDAIKNKNSVSQSLQSAVRDMWGNTLARSPQDKPGRDFALNLIETAGKMIFAADFQQDPYFLKLNSHWYHISKAQAHLHLGMPRTALEELSNMQSGDPRSMRRYLTASINEAEAYIADGKMEMGVAYAESALSIAHDVKSNLHLARITSMYEALRKHDKYNRSTDVARLGVKLLQCSHPELFN